VVLLNAWVAIFAVVSGFLLLALGVACFVPPARKYMHNTRAGAILAALHSVQRCSDATTEQATELPDGAHSLTVTNAPQHVAMIMDGNRRYGKKHHNNPLKGHTDGGDTLVNVMDWCIELGVEMLTVYAFSTENWNRPREEVETLMRVFESHAEKIRAKAVARGIRVHLLASEPELLPKQTYETLQKLVDQTADGTKFTLNLCVSYGSRSEIVGAAKALAQAVLNGEMKLDQVNEEKLNSKLLTGAFPDPDLLIRTSEARLSNFLLWQLAYTEIQFLDKLWPEVSQQDIRDAFESFAKRKRRFGK